jgi:general stress protein YciG
MQAVYWLCPSNKPKEEIMANNNMNQNQSKSDQSRTQDDSKNASSRSGGNAGNFKNDPEKAAEAGRKGGEARSGQTRQ